jgi:hypothetical protein
MDDDERLLRERIQAAGTDVVEAVNTLIERAVEAARARARAATVKDDYMKLLSYSEEQVVIIRNQLNDALEKLALEKDKVAHLKSEILDKAIRRRHAIYSCALSVPRAHVPNCLF